MKLSDELKHWGYHASLSEEGKKQHLEMSEKAAQLEEENDALKDRDKRVCCLCNDKTTRISFRLGYGSSRDGDCVCWDCASKFDALLTQES